MISFLKEFFEFLMEKKKILVVTNYYNLIIIWSFNSLKSGSAVAPFIYTIF